MSNNNNLLIGVLAGTAATLTIGLLLNLQSNSSSRNHNNNNNNNNNNETRQRQRNSIAKSSSNDEKKAARRRRASSIVEEIDTYKGTTPPRGFSMKEAEEHNKKSVTRAEKRTPDEVLHDLQRGNTRFWMCIPNQSVTTAFERRGLMNKQHPSVAILGCADSRVPIEIIFDQGVGDIFTIRVAGNCLDTSTEGSLEYAVCHLHVKVLIIMGHEGCGAVGAARSSNKELEKQPKCLCDLLKNVKGGLDDTRLNVIQDEKAGDREAVVSNVKYQVGNLLLNQAVKNSVDKGELIVMGAFYNQSSGIVDFIEIH